MNKPNMEQRKKNLENIVNISPVESFPSRFPTYPPVDPPEPKVIASIYFEIIQPSTVLDVKQLSVAQNRLTRSLMAKIRSREEGLLDEVVKAIATYEDFVILEAKILVHSQLDNQIKKTAKLKKVKSEYASILRPDVITQIENGSTLSPQQEAQLSLLLEQFPGFWQYSDLGNAYFSRPPHRTKQTFRDALAIIIFTLIRQYAKNENQRQVGRCKALTVEIISAISPILKTEFSKKIVEHAIY